MFKFLGEKLAAQGQRRETHLPFVDAVPIMVQPDEKTITTDVIHRAERQFDAETFGMNAEEDADKVKHEGMYHHQQPVYTTYASTSQVMYDEDGNEVIEDGAEYYEEDPYASRHGVIVKEEMEQQERHQAKRQMLGMPRYSSLVMSTADTRNYNNSRMTEIEQLVSLITF